MDSLNPNIFIKTGHNLDFTDMGGVQGVRPDEYVDSLNVFAADAGAHRMHLFPNFSLGGLLGPQGYVMEIPTSKILSSWIFAQPIFRIISFFEIKYNDVIPKLSQSNEYKDMIRKAIMLETPHYPKLGDTSDANWSPALGHDGTSIGIYSFDEKHGADQVTRYFIGVHSGLHYQTCKEFYDKLVQTSYNNRNLMSSNETSEIRHTNIVTFADMINEGLMANLRQIARENNRRMATQFQEVLKLEFKSAETITLLSDTQCTPVSDKDDVSKQALTNVLNWYPPKIPLFTDTYIQNIQEEEFKDDAVATRLQIQENLTGTCIGNIAKEYMLTKEINKKYNFNVYVRRSTIFPTLECDYNTYRIRGDSLIWYNNCTPTVPSLKEANFGVIRQMSSTQGFELFNSMISNNNKDQHADEYMRWDNEHANGFPVVYPQVRRKEQSPKFLSHTLDMFFSYYTGNSPANANSIVPTQLRYIPSEYMHEDASLLSRDCYPKTFIPNIIQLQPAFVYLSPCILFSSNTI